MHHINLLKIGFSLIAALSGNPGASPSDVAIGLVKQFAVKKMRREQSTLQHCGVCHANAA